MNLYKITWRPKTGLMDFHTFVVSHCPETAIMLLNPELERAKEKFADNRIVIVSLEFISDSVLVQ